MPNRKNVLKAIAAIAVIAASMSAVGCESDSVGSFKDSRDSKKYKIVKIGEQTWMAENLNYNASGSKCYDNKKENCMKYGRLYNWNTAMKACPNGWHLPSNKEWDKLYRFVDGTSGTESPYRSETAGKHLKAKSGWNSIGNSNGNGEDTYGFSAFPGGSGLSDGGFGNNFGNDGIWWSSSEEDSDYSYSRYMIFQLEDASYMNSFKSHLFPIRCLQDTKGKTKENESAKASEPAKSEEVNASQATAELEREAKKWRNESDSYQETEGKFFSFKNKKDDSGLFEWTATNKTKIDNCPSKSVWMMHEEGYYNTPSGCEFLTPKIITEFGSD